MRFGRPVRRMVRGFAGDVSNETTTVRRMRVSNWWIVPLVAFVLFASRTSFAQQAPRAARTGFGIGAEATTTGIVGGTFVYDASAFHIDALLGGTFNPEDSVVAVAGRLFFPLHTSQSADFSIGPGVGIQRRTDRPANEPSVSTNAAHIEGAVQIRAFVVPNVALSASAGVGAVFRNGSNSAVIGGQLGGALGITYFFF
jgi:hypothetical protein